MRKIIKSAVLASAIALSQAILAAPAHAQIAAALPMVEEVERGEATDADGTYVVSTINKRITIENGRAYVVDPWTQAILFRVKPGMVTLRNFRQTGPNEFEADDLPMMGKVTFYRQPDGSLEGVVKGAMGEAKYVLVPTEYATVPGTDSGGIPSEQSEPVEEWHVYVRQLQCTRKKFDVNFLNGANGEIRIEAAEAFGFPIRPLQAGLPRISAPDKRLGVDCLLGQTKRKTYSYSAADQSPGLLILRGTRSELAEYKLRFSFDWKYRPGFKDRKDSRVLSVTPLQTRGLPIGESHSTTWKIAPKSRPELQMLLRVKRIK